MKEAAGEANMTVVTIILIAAIVAIATPLISSVMKQSKQKTCCLSAGGSGIQGGTCVNQNGTAINSSDYTDCVAGK